MQPGVRADPDRNSASCYPFPYTRLDRTTYQHPYTNCSANQYPCSQCHCHADTAPYRNT